MGPMGFAVAAVVGGKLAAPDAACVAVVGDGAFLMHGSEISTAADQSAGAIWIVLDDGDLTMVSQGQAEFFRTLDWTDYYKLGNNDLVGYATALGAKRGRGHGRRTRSPPRLQAAFAGAATGTPQVISVKVDPAAEPPYYATPGLTMAEALASSGAAAPSYVPGHVLRRLAGGAPPRRRTPSASTARCCSADIRGFTRLTEQMAARGPDGVETVHRRDEPLLRRDDRLRRRARRRGRQLRRRRAARRLAGGRRDARPPRSTPPPAARWCSPPATPPCAAGVDARLRVRLAVATGELAGLEVGRPSRRSTAA